MKVTQDRLERNNKNNESGEWAGRTGNLQENDQSNTPPAPCVALGMFKIGLGRGGTTELTATQRNAPSLATSTSQPPSFIVR